MKLAIFLLILLSTQLFAWIVPVEAAIIQSDEESGQRATFTKEEQTYKQVFEAFDHAKLYSFKESDSLLSILRGHALKDQASIYFKTKYLTAIAELANYQQSPNYQNLMDSAMVLAKAMPEEDFLDVLMLYAKLDYRYGYYDAALWKYDSLKNWAIKTDADTLEAWSRLQIGYVKIDQWKVDEAFLVIKEAEDYYKSTGQILGLLESKLARYWAIYQSGKLYESLDSVATLKHECVRLNDSHLIMNCEKLIAQINYHLGIYPPAIEAYSAVEKYALASNNRVEQAKQLGNIAYAYRMLTDFSKAVDYASLKKAVCDSMGDEIRVADAYILLYQIYHDNRQTDLQLEVIGKAMQIYQRNNSLGGIANAYNSYGNTYEALEQFEKALDAYQSSYEIRKGYKKSYWVIPLYNIGYTLVKLERYQESLQYFEESLAICEEQHIIGMKIRNLAGLAEAYLQLDRIPESVMLINEAEPLVSKTNYQRMKRDVYGLAATVYEADKNFKMALLFHKLFKSQNDSIYNDESNERFAAMEIKYQTKEKDQINAMLKQDVKIKEVAIRNQQQWNLIGLVVLVFSLGGVFVFYRNNKLLNLKNRKIENQSRSIEERNNQIETLLREVHHRVKNNLQLITSLLDVDVLDLSPEKAVDVLSDSQSRVATMSLIHQNLYMNDNLASVVLSDYLVDLTTNLSEIHMNHDADIKINVGDVAFDVDTMIPLGLAMNELITNAFKYTSEGKSNFLAIHHEYMDGKQSIHIIDHNEKLPLPFEELKSTGYGIRLADRLMQQLLGNISYRYDGGNVFVLRFLNTAERKLID